MKPEQIIFFHDLLNICKYIAKYLEINQEEQEVRSEGSGLQECMEIFGDKQKHIQGLAFLSPLGYSLLSVSVNREVPINIDANYLCVLGGKYTPKSNYFMLITEPKTYSLISGQKNPKTAIVQIICSRIMILSLCLNQPVL